MSMTCARVRRVTRAKQKAEKKKNTFLVSFVNESSLHCFASSACPDTVVDRNNNDALFHASMK